MAKEVPYQFNVDIPKGYSTAEREAIAAEIISFVRERTLKQKDYEMGRFPEYEKNYAALKGVGRKQVNLKLSGAMLAELDTVKNKDGKLVIGYEEGSAQQGKAEGNQIGSYGQPQGNPDKARRFLGIRDDHLKKILDKYPIDDPEASAKRAAQVVEADKKVRKFSDIIKKSGEPNDTMTGRQLRTLAKNFKLKIG